MVEELKPVKLRTGPPPAPEFLELWRTTHAAKKGEPVQVVASDNRHFVYAEAHADLAINQPVVVHYAGAAVAEGKT